jgi:hypothetical protein
MRWSFCGERFFLFLSQEAFLCLCGVILSRDQGDQGNFSRLLIRAKESKKKCTGAFFFFLLVAMTSTRAERE